MKSIPTPSSHTSLPATMKQRAHIGLLYAKARWKHGLALAALGIFLWKMDYGFGLMPITKAQGQHAALLMPEMDVEAVHVNFRETRTKPSKAREQAPKEKTVQTKGDIDGLNLANEATATSNALSPQQKEAAARISNLSIALDPDFARRKNLDPAVVREKMRICRQYIQTYLETAREEARKFNIPVAITLAQGLLESNAGESRLAVKANNHFGIKCFSRTCDKGHCMNATDDSHKDFFVVFGSGTESFRARSKFLCKDRYKHLLQLKRTEYKKWAHGLKKAGYATDPNYARKLIALIENLKLYVYDQS